ncbi:MAG: response regulator [Candidatus Omnitrophota bacterium]|nr:response regulator [Candidatus Omnitrophota bacterium]
MDKKILVVDDEQNLVTMVAFRLERAGYSVITAFDGQEALDTVYKEMPDLIILDLMLPKIDGYKVCKTLKYGGQPLNIPIIIFTACAQGDEEIYAYECGADAYIVKPFEPVVLLAKIKELLGEGKNGH